VTPGDALLFDYRVLHRGTLNNTGGARPVFVLTVAKPWFRDLVNFPKRALFPEVDAVDA
jgi:ectoine hydroxylase-related dioxygenase (phytanoyl-CoA dioxygenase family)